MIRGFLGIFQKGMWGGLLNFSVDPAQMPETGKPKGNAKNRFASLHRSWRGSRSTEVRKAPSSKTSVPRRGKRGVGDMECLLAYRGAKSNRIMRSPPYLRGKGRLPIRPDIVGECSRRRWRSGDREENDFKFSVVLLKRTTIGAGPCKAIAEDGNGWLARIGFERNSELCAAKPSRERAGDEQWTSEQMQRKGVICKR